MGGIRSLCVYFHSPPTPAQVLTRVRTLAGFPIGVASQAADELTVFLPAKPALAIELGWSVDRLRKLQLLQEALGPDYQPPFPNRPHSITLALAPRTTRSYAHLEASLLVVLKEFGGEFT